MPYFDIDVLTLITENDYDKFMINLCLILYIKQEYFSALFHLEF